LGDLCNDAAMTDNSGDDMNARIRRGRSLPLFRAQQREGEPGPEPEPTKVDLGAGPRPMPSPADPHAAINAWIRQQAHRSGLLGQTVSAPTTRRNR
jgi:hypothetical protein